MNFTELKTELFARGTNYLEEDASEIARGERWLNQAYREILNLMPWPFLEATATGSSGAGLVSVPDLRKIRLVTDVSSGGNPGRKLTRITFDDLVSDEAMDLNSTGLPDFYWVQGGNIINGYPFGGTVRAYYYRRAPILSGTDDPLFEEDYHDLIVDRAMIKAYKDSDNFEAAAALKVEYDAGLAAMAEDYLLDSREIQYITPTGEDMG